MRNAYIPKLLISILILSDQNMLNNLDFIYYFNYKATYLNKYASVLELVDKLDSKSSVRKYIPVQVRALAP